MTCKTNRVPNLAKQLKYDEFYPEMDTIEETVTKYYRQFKNKRVYLNTDDYRESAFWRLFYDNFEKWGLKSLTATGFKRYRNGIYAHYDGKKVTVKELYGDGDYWSMECRMILSQNDIVVTCPPYSIGRKFITNMISSGKKFLLLVSHYSLTYTETIKELLNGKFHIEHTGSGTLTFRVTNKYDKSRFIKNGKVYAQVQSMWISNMNCRADKSQKVLELDETDRRYFSPCKTTDEIPDLLYAKYVKDIPFDYVGAVHVPTSISYFMDPENNVTFEKKIDGHVYQGKMEFLGNTDIVYGMNRIHLNNKKKFAGLIFFKKSGLPLKKNASKKAL